MERANGIVLQSDQGLGVEAGEQIHVKLQQSNQAVGMHQDFQR